MKDRLDFWSEIKVSPNQFYIIHYSSQSLFDSEGIDGQGALSPRITSIVIRHFATSQTISFATHTVAEYLKIPGNEIEHRLDEIEKELLSKFYSWIRDRKSKYWIHWKMKNVTFGFEHLEHRYRVLTGDEPPNIPAEVRIDLSEQLINRYGPDYAGDPRMMSLMLLNGPRIQEFLTGQQESDAFKAKDFIRMNDSTIAKVGFFDSVIKKTLKGKLKTKGGGLINKIDRLLEGRSSRVIAFISAVLGIAATILLMLF